MIFLHGSHGSADDLYNYTSLRSKAGNFVVSSSVSGFAVAAVQGRNLHWLGPNPAASHHDNLFRDLASPSSNPDIADLDHLVDSLVVTGKIDPARIYVVGWSNGAFFAQLYAIARHATATPGGNRVAAAVAYAGADPFSDPTGADPNCELATYPTSTIPIYLIHRACDALVPCSPAQATALGAVPGYVVEPWVSARVSRVADPNARDTIIDGNGQLVTSCAVATLCTNAGGTLNHLRWPDGVADGSGRDWEIAMLEFMRAHPNP
jgi:poly(3-hydroxybutyrate) depolymerase